MTANGLLKNMLAWRRLIECRPDMAGAVREEVDGWLSWHRKQPPDVSNPQLLIIADLSCTDDLRAHVGIAQLLALRRIRCELVLSFPNESIAGIARGLGLREGWHGLFQVVDPAQRRQLIELLPADTPLAVFHGPAVLSPQSLEGLFVARHPWLLLPGGTGELTGESMFLTGDGFFGRAADYVQPAEATDFSGELDTRLDMCPAELGLGLEPWVPGPRNNWPNADSSVGATASQADTVELPSIDPGDELILRHHRYPLTSEVIERRFARSCVSGQPIEIRPTAGLLTSAPRIVRLESYKANGRVVGCNMLVRVAPSQLQPSMLSAFLNRGGGGNPVIRAFAQGTACRLAYAEDEPETLSEVPVVWGVLRESDRILAQAKSRGMYFFYIDHAYFDRGHGKSYRITRNRYEAGPIRKCPADRLAQLDIEVRPWQKAGRDIIVCPPTDYFIQAHDCADWLDTTLAALRNATDRPITIREKPQPGETAVPLRTALKTAHALVTHSSNVAIEAACLGTPVFVNSASAAAPVGQTDLAKIEEPVYPDRDPWLAHLAYSQFSIEEIRDGLAWRLLLETEERDFA